MSVVNRVPRVLLAALPAIVITASSVAAPTTSAQQHPPKPVAPAAVTAITLRPIKTRMDEPCPAHLKVLADLETNGATTVKYTWISSEGESWPESTVNFTAATTQSVSTDWTIGKPGAKLDAWVQLSVLAPNRKLSEKLPVGLSCAKAP
jgi:hypothetical protein